jgi:hypothetical protein
MYKKIPKMIQVFASCNLSNKEVFKLTKVLDLNLLIFFLEMFNLLYIITGNYNIRVFKTHSQSFLAILKKIALHQLYISAPNLSALWKTDLIVPKYTCTYQLANLEVKGSEEEYGSQCKCTREIIQK